MDFGVLGLDTFVSSEKLSSSSSRSNNSDSKPKIVGSGSSKQERSSGSAQDEWRSSKISRTDDFSVPKTMPLHQVTPLLRSNPSLGSGQGAEHMLCFSSVKSEPTGSRDGGGLLDKSTPNTSAFPYYQQAASAYARSAGYGAGSLNGSMHGGFAGVRGPFTPSQWIELEHQALIYKYITANVPIPSNLLIPLKKSLYPFGLAGSSTGSFHPNSLGWGAFHLGYHGNSNDPEPGRCRRTDGKKWRCSRDAVADQKYCERHINRGRHRSRKPVEGQTGHAAPTGTTNCKVAPMTTTVSTSVVTSSEASNSLAITQQQLKNSQQAAAIAPADSIVNRAQDHRSVPIALKSDESTFAVPKQEPRIQVVSQPEFGLVTSDSLLNPLQRSSYVTSKNYESYLSFNDQETQDQHNLRQFMDDWPKDHSSRSVISWPEELKSDWTQLSMSIPMGSSDFSSSSSSPIREKLNLSPLRPSREFNPVEMGLGVSGDLSESSQKHTSWIPISWETSMGGGPLGEVLTTSTGNVGSWKSSAALHLLTERWNGSSPQFGSSPTGVLQKAPFGSLSNSSSGCSPRAESRKNKDGSSYCDNVLGCTIISPSSIASL